MLYYLINFSILTAVSIVTHAWQRIDYNKFSYNFQRTLFKIEKQLKLHLLFCTNYN